ncbi:MAG: PepSY domain-containing protein [Colwellia sp.]|jgi:uncharacterized membrane protein YkoI|nr:PepSY domain-containing protein [Colwellia sp.]MCW9082778.1 PepSY domain-containing protein [Colwellia sp.]
MINQFKIFNPIFAVCLCCSIVILTLSSSIFAAEDHEQALDLVDSGDIIPLAIILKNLQKIEQGQIIEVELEIKKKQLIYEIELVNNEGIIKEYSFDAKTGKLIK